MPRYYTSHRRTDDDYMSHPQMDDDTVVIPVVTDETVFIPAVADDTVVIPAVTHRLAPDTPRTRHRAVLAGVLLIASAGVGGYYVVDAGMDARLDNSAVPGTLPPVPSPPDFAEQAPLQPAETTPSPTDQTVQVPYARVQPSAAPRRRSPSPSRSPSPRPSSASPSPSAPGSPSPSPNESTSPPPSPIVIPGIPDHEDHGNHGDHGDHERTLGASATVQRIRAMLQERQATARSYDRA